MKGYFALRTVFFAVFFGAAVFAAVFFVAVFFLGAIPYLGECCPVDRSVSG